MNLENCDRPNAVCQEVFWPDSAHPGEWSYVYMWRNFVQMRVLPFSVSTEGP